MDRPRIILMGDDGFNSIGTRILVAVLRDAYDLTVIGTTTQQSSVGGKVNVRTGGRWAKAEVDGVPGFCVDGSPVDAVECARVYYPGQFDLAISGINLGINVGGLNITSGTFAAAHRAVSIGLARAAIVMSWDVDPSLFFSAPTGTDAIDGYMDYPGRVARKLVDICRERSFWNADVVNVNFPAVSAYRGSIRFTGFMDPDAGFWPPVIVDEKEGTFTYPNGDHDRGVTDLRWDTGAVLNGDISVTLCRWNMAVPPHPDTGIGMEVHL